MSTPFDGIRALKEELEGLGGVLRTVTVRERAAQEALGKAEVDYNDIVKIRGFVRAEIDRKRAVLIALE